MNFSKELLEQAKSALERLYNARNNAEYLLENAQVQKQSPGELEWFDRIMDYREQFKTSMEDDINTADALSAIFELVKEMNSYLNDLRSRQTIQDTLNLFYELTSVLGIVQKRQDDLEGEIETLIQKRQQARKEKDWELADQIRDQLSDMGIQLEDTPQGVKWKRV